jgi:hypothetical protein
MPKPQHTRSRNWVSFDNVASAVRTPTNAVYKDKYWHHEGLSSQTTISQGNRVHLLGKSRGPIGGSFSTTWNECVGMDGCHPVHFVTDVPSRGRWTFDGMQAPVLPSAGSYPAMPVHDVTEMTVAGMQAIARTTPTKPQQSVLNTIGELRRDGIPTIPRIREIQGRADVLRQSGSEYLNVEFGWKPLVNDLQTYARTLKRVSRETRKTVNSMRVDVRANYTFPEESFPEVLIGTYTSNQPQPIISDVYGKKELFTGLGQSGNPIAGTRTVTYTKSQETWFSGKYSFYVPVGDDLLSRLGRYEQEANRLLGTRLTPETVWNLAPWSWLVDYVVDVGDLVSNFSNFLYDGLVLRYGYVMRTTKAHNTHVLTGPIRQDGVRRWEMRFSSVRKTRIPASPYGFGIDFDGLSGRQVAILVALGLSQNPTAR